MNKIQTLIVILVVAVVAVGALGYWQGWFSVSSQGVQVDTKKFKQDRDAFSKSVGEKTKVMRDKVSSLWKKSEGLTGEEKAQARKELGELKTKHDRIEEQIKELEDAGPDRFVSIQQDLSKSLEDVNHKIEELSKKLEKGKGK